MKALITGASGGLGIEIAKELASKGIDLVLVARDKKKLEELAKEFSVNVDVVSMDLSSTFNCTKLYNKYKDENIDIIINNAGFGVHGFFTETKLDKELDMIDLNIKAVQTLTKLFLRDMKEKNFGYILNVSSTAAYLPGPLMASYYASKAYVMSFSEAINTELRKEKSSVYVGVLAPGPIDTNFQEKAGIKLSAKPMKSADVAKIAIKGMLTKKRVIIPGKMNKVYAMTSKILPRKVLSAINYEIQAAKIK